MANGDTYSTPTSSEGTEEQTSAYPDTTAGSSATAATQDVAQKPDPAGDQSDLQARIDALNELRKQREQYDADTKTITDRMKDIQNQMSVAPPQPPQYTDPRTVQQQRGGLATNIAQVISMAMIGAAVFGRHRNPWANAALMSGAGSFMKGFADGQKNLAKDQLENWNKLTEYQSKQYEAQRQYYNEVLANKRLDLQQQMDLIRSHADQTRDSKMFDAANRKDLDAVIQNIEAKGSAAFSYAKARLHITSDMMLNYMQEHKQAWSEYVRQQSKKDKDPIDPSASEAEFMKAMDKYPVSEFLADSRRKLAAAEKAAKPLTPDSVQKEASGYLGRGKSGPWVTHLDNDGQVEQGRIDDKGNWVGDPKGPFVSFSDTEESGHAETDVERLKELKAHAISQENFDRLKAQVEKLHTQEEGTDTGTTQQTTKSGYQKLSPEQEKSMIKAGTLKPGDIFEDQNGNLRQVPEPIRPTGG